VQAGRAAASGGAAADQPGRLTARLFAAALPPPALRTRLAAGVAALRDDALRAVPVENLHVTVEFLGDVAEDEIEPLTAALREVVSCLPAFSLRVIGTELAPKRRPRMLWAVTERSEPLGSLAREVDRAAAPFAPARGRPAGERGHITLARFRGRVMGLEPQSLEEEFAVDEVVLMRSRLSPAGATYAVVAAMPLSA
jgi:RNA 2',3'-cyclic 3'-phosphodiesterase